MQLQLLRQRWSLHDRLQLQIWRQPFLLESPTAASGLRSMASLVGSTVAAFGHCGNYGNRHDHYDDYDHYDHYDNHYQLISATAGPTRVQLINESTVVENLAVSSGNCHKGSAFASSIVVWML